MADYVTTDRCVLFHKDCLMVAHEYDNDFFQLLMTSTEYPGLAGNKQSPRQWLFWWRERLEAWVPKVHHRTGVIIQNIKYPRTATGWFDMRQFTDLNHLYQLLGLHVIDVYIWDKLNAPPSGNQDRHDRDEWEICYALARSAGYTFNKYRKPYAAKTKGKAKADNKMRESDVRGSHAGGHSRLHEDGARQSNVLRISSSGDQGRPRIKGGVFPRELAERFIYTFSDELDWIVDPCMGSGTVPVEAVKQSRQAVGCDISKKAFETAHRWVIEIEGEQA